MKILFIVIFAVLSMNLLANEVTIEDLQKIQKAFAQKKGNFGKCIIKTSEHSYYEKTIDKDFINGTKITLLTANKNHKNLIFLKDRLISKEKINHNEIQIQYENVNMEAEAYSYSETTEKEIIILTINKDEILVGFEKKFLKKIDKEWEIQQEESFNCSVLKK